MIAKLESKFGIENDTELGVTQRGILTTKLQPPLNPVETTLSCNKLFFPREKHYAQVSKKTCILVA